MAITIRQSPTSPNYSKSELIYVATSDQTTQDQFSYVVDIYRGTTRIARRYRQPNPSGSLVVNVADIIDANLEYDISALGSSTSITASTQAQTFSVRFGEEYLSNNTLTIFADLATSGDLRIIKGVREYNTGDFSSSLGLPSTLTHMPVSGTRLHRDDTLTISFYDTVNNRLTHDAISIPSTGSTLSVDVNSVSYSFNIYDTRSEYGETRFVWANHQGGWDYFTADKQHTESRSKTNNFSTGSVVNFSGSTSSSNKETSNSNVFRSRENIYNVDRGSTFTVMTKWLSQQEFAWIESLFSSPRTYIYQGTNFIPVVITNDFTPFRVNREHTLQNLNIEYRLANDLRNI